MANPLFNLLNQQNTQNPNGNMLEQWNSFKNTFSGNPEQMVKGMLQSGQMSQQQFNQLSALANSLRGVLK